MLLSVTDKKRPSYFYIIYNYIIYKDLAFKMPILSEENKLKLVLITDILVWKLIKQSMPDQLSASSWDVIDDKTGTLPITF